MEDLIANTLNMDRTKVLSTGIEYGQSQNIVAWLKT